MPILRYTLRLSVVAMCLAVLTACEPEADTRPVLELTTTPPGATITLDGQTLDKQVTPLKGRILPGEHMIEVNLPGYRPAFLAVPSTSSGDVILDVTLQPLTTAIHIDTVPAGASVKMDGKNVGVTPLMLPSVTLGDHELTLSAAGYADRTVTVNVPDARPQRWGYDLTSVMGSVKVVSSPGGAEVYVDGHLKGRTPNVPAQALVLTDLMEGKHDLRIVLPNHREVTDAFVLEAGSVKTLTPYRLEQLPGGVTLESVPEGAQVFYNGGMVGVTPHTIENLRPGQYEYELRMDEYKNANASVTISAGIVKQTVVKLTKTTGSIILSTEPPGCVVMLDRVRIGTTQRGDNEQVSEVLTHDGIQPGPHLLQIEHPKYEPWKRSITITEGEDMNLNTIVLDKRFIPTHRLEIKSPVNGKISTYDGVLVKEHPDGSIDFQTAKTMTTTFGKAEIKSINRIR